MFSVTHSAFVRVIVCLVAFFLSTCQDLEKQPVAPPSVDRRLSTDSTLSLNRSLTAAADLWVYQDALEPPWINASWSASVTFNNTEQVSAGSYAVKVALTAAWGALSLHYGYWYTQGIDPTQYQSVDFAIHGGPSGANIRVFFENDAGQTFPRVNYGTIPANQWTVVSIPMSQLNPNNLTINRVDIQDLSGGTPTFYVDNFRFVGTSQGGTPPTAPTLASPSNGATGIPTNPTLSWNASSGATSYRLQVSTSSGFTSTTADQSGITATSYALSGLSYSTTYYWRVNASNSAGTSSWSTAFSFTTTAAPPPPTQAPDLTVDASRLRSTLQTRWRNFSSSSCAVVEGCASPGYRRILRFEVTVQNFGNADVKIGDPADPANSRLFVWSPCHGHFHFEGFADYRLLNSSSQLLVAGHKQAFCLTDSRQYWSGYPSRGYNCDYQGISVGWGDVYDRYTDCQWVDITNIPPGDYILEVEVNVGGKIYEGNNTRPNIVQVPVRIQ